MTYENEMIYQAFKVPMWRAQELNKEVSDVVRNKLQHKQFQHYEEMSLYMVQECQSLAQNEAELQLTSFMAGALAQSTLTELERAMGIARSRNILQRLIGKIFRI